MKQKTVLVTGSTSGIGRACATRFAADGYRVIATGRNAEKLNDLKTELEQSGAEVFVLIFDVRDSHACAAAIASLPADWRQIDVLINNAGLALGLDKEYEIDAADMEAMVDTNIKGLLTMTRLVVPQMVEHNQGHVINIGSVAGDVTYAGGSVYCATKAAVKALSDGLRIDVADSAVRVTNLKPGLVQTNFSTTRFHGDKQRAAQVYKGVKPLTGDDIADVALYCANAPAHVQIAEVLVLATHQANATFISRNT